LPGRAPHFTAPLCAAVAIAIGCCAPASAATQIGSTPAPPVNATDPGASCTANSFYLQSVTTSSSPSYTVPAGGGVISRWAYNSNGSAGQKRLKIFRLNAGRYTVIGESDWQAAPQNQLYRYPTRIAVQAGDVLGVSTTSANDCRAPAPSGNQVSGGSGDPAEGTSYGQSNFGVFTTSTLLDVAALVEPDADGDGYGDETQDGCPGDPQVFATPCRADLKLTVTPTPAKVRLGDRVTYTIALRNDGPTAARDVVVTDVLPKGAPLVQAPATCTGFSTLTCKVGTLARGASAPVLTVVTRAPSVGTLKGLVTATSSTSDPAPANNVVVPAVRSLPQPFAGTAVRTGRTRASRGRVGVRVRCPITASVCSGTLKLGGIGSAPFKVRAGRTKLLHIKIPAKAGRRLASRGSLRLRATTSSHDRYGQKAPRHAKITLLAPRAGKGAGR
jgi:uncharacterized repeat protein (TIGR01451 family)